MAWWQMLGISLASGLIGLWFIGIGWWYLRRANPNAVDPGPSNESLVKQVKQDNQDRGKEKCRADGVLLAREVQELIAAKISLDVLPRLQQAAVEVRHRINEAFEAKESQESQEETNGDLLKELSLEAPDVYVPPEPFLLNTDFREYRLKDLLGAGGFGRVQLVEELHSNQVPPPVAAWKALSKTATEKAGMSSNVVMEKRIMAVTKVCPSPFIVSYHGCCQTPRYIYFKMEALLGGELYRTYVKNKHILSGSKVFARYYLACALTAVEHLHQLRVMLRSLKPEDRALDLKGQLKIFDFGLSKFIVDKTYATCGTPDYFSPEIISSTGHSFPVDWWCAGVMLFELLSGDPPFTSNYPMMTYQKVVKGIKNISFPGTIPSDAKNLICSLCENEPNKRLPEAKGFEALQKHAFFKDFNWEGLSSMTPPFLPSSNEKNYGATEEDLHPCFQSPGDPKDIKNGEFWSAHFGPVGERDDHPLPFA